jgi:Peptidase family M1 domain
MTHAYKMIRQPPRNVATIAASAATARISSGANAVATIAAVLILLCCSACAVPFAPGFHIVKQSSDVHFLPGQSPGQASRVQIRCEYVARNSGNADLDFVDISLPEEKQYGRSEVRFEIDGHEVSPASIPADLQQDEPNALRVNFDPSWTRGQVHTISVQYTLASPANRGTRITLDAASFHLGSRGAFPQLQPPKRFLAPYPRRPDRTIYTVRVPSDFLLLARGTLVNRKKDGAETGYRFILRKKDLEPFVVAGRYVAWPSGRSDSTVFWTLQPLKDDASHAAGEIQATWKVLVKDFGPLDRNIAAPHIVESPDLRASVMAETGPAAAAFPGGALVNPAALALGVNSDQFLEIVTRALAHNWFADEMYPVPYAELGMGEGLADYATIVIEEERNGPDARRKRIVQLIQRYDEARSRADETPLGVTMLTDPMPQRRIALAKAPLFYVALEDICGEAQTRAGLAHLVSILRGDEVDYDDLRAALEQSSGKNLGDTFRTWLNLKGIPEDFRSRYLPARAGATTGSTVAGAN